MGTECGSRLGLQSYKELPLAELGKSNRDGKEDSWVSDRDGGLTHSKKNTGFWWSWQVGREGWLNVTWWKLQPRTIDSAVVGLQREVCTRAMGMHETVCGDRRGWRRTQESGTSREGDVCLCMLQAVLLTQMYFCLKISVPILLIDNLYWLSFYKQSIYYGI